MKKGLIIIIVIVAVVLLGAKWVVSTRNGIIVDEQAVEKAWGNVENQYQRRLDLIPNLVNSVKGYAQHESSTYEKVTEARAGLKSAYNDAKALTTTDTPDDLSKFQEAQNALNRQLAIYVNAVHEAYPDLKANTLFMNLQDELAGTENRIATERTRYNDTVEQYNIKIMKFPASLVAWGFSKREMFKADAEAQHAPKVDFGTDSSSAASSATSSASSTTTNDDDDW